MADVMQSIVVAYDDPGSKTLERAAQLAGALGSSLVVTNVAAAAEGTQVDRAREEAQGKLEEARRVLEEQGVQADYVLTRGNPGEAIAGLAKERGANLIVVGTRRKKFLERLVEGSVLQEVLRRADPDCDVLVVG